ncbi:hypothetical protein, partial [Mesorhizobium sp.]|uniref:hypothetical protein n=1 Tax=Mesorhizobium sp. TaxID=1871066 RepID=UPI0025BD55CF
MRGSADADNCCSCAALAVPFSLSYKTRPTSIFEHHFASVTAGLANSSECTAGAAIGAACSIFTCSSGGGSRPVWHC